jgi:hypothetical protein
LRFRQRLRQGARLLPGSNAGLRFRLPVARLVPGARSLDRRAGLVEASRTQWSPEPATQRVALIRTDRGRGGVGTKSQSIDAL